MYYFVLILLNLRIKYCEATLENIKMAFKTPGYFYVWNSEVFNHRNRRECVLVS